MGQELFGRNVLSDDEVLNGSFGRSNPSSQLELLALQRVTDRADSLNTVKGLSDNTRDECRGSGRRNTRSHDNSRQSKNTAINQTSSSVLVDEKLGRKFAHAISAFGGSNGVDVDNVRERTTINGEGRGEDKLDGFARDGSGLSGGLQHHSDGINVDLYPTISPLLFKNLLVKSP